MAQTITFSAGSYQIGDAPGPGTEKLKVVKSGNRFLLSNTDKSTIVNLGLLGINSAARDNIEFLAASPSTNPSVDGLTANLQAGNDILRIRGQAINTSVDMGLGADTFISDGGIRNSTISGNWGNDKFIFNGTGENVFRSTIDGGGNNDTFTFNGSFVGGTVIGGQGADRATFKGAVSDFNGQRSTIDMGTENDVLVFGGPVSGTDIMMGAGANQLTASQAVSTTNISGGNNADRATFNSTFSGLTDLRRATVDLAGGNDTLVFNGTSVTNANLLVGAGADNITIKKDITNSTLDLGGDRVKDTVRLTPGSNFTGFRITGADTKDRLIIGSSTYRFQSNRTWVNVSNPSDRVQF
jgi:hypothetical protein